MRAIRQKKSKILLLLIFILIFFYLVSTPSLMAGNFEFQLSYGRWSLSPFTTILEKESENLVKEGLKQLVDPLLPRYTQSIIQSNIDFSSSGQSVSMNFWYNFKSNRFSLGFKGNYINFSLPYMMLSQQTIDFLNFTLVKLDLQGDGEVNLRSGTLSLLGRWAPVSGSVFKWWFYGGVILYFYEGDVSIQQKIVLDTPIGDLSYAGSFDHTIEEMRKISEDIPASFFSPEFGTQVQYAFHRHLGLYIDISVSQGSFFSGGIYLTF